MSEVLSGMKVCLIISFLDYRKPPKMLVLILHNISEVLSGMKVCLLNIFLGLP